MLFLPLVGWAQNSVQVGSKRFTESYILGEIVAQTVSATGSAQAVHRRGLGNTGILYAALESGAIDVYPEYTGTIAFELLGLKRPHSIDELNRLLQPRGLAVGVPLGFNNSYALAMTERQAAALGVQRISELAQLPQLRFGLSQEFVNRRDGWPALKGAYGLPGGNVRGLDHGLAYEAVAGGQVDVVDVYATDAKIVRYGLRVLIDDRGFFPTYDAVLLYRRDLPERFPQAWPALQALEGRISAARMTAMNAAAEISGRTFARVAGEFLEAVPAGDGKESRRTFLEFLFGG
ncbi:MAG: amino acid ABC transporter permease, partial [Betaproteobacteria bacterium]